MISLSEIGGLYMSVPDNIKDAQTKAFMYACDRQIKKLLEYAEKVKVWCAIDSLDEGYLDYVAADIRPLFYESTLAPDIKRKLIANSQYWHMKLGTSAAVEEMINTVFGKGKVQEWYQYGGQPYYFKILTDAPMNPESIKQFQEMIARVKNTRSLLDTIEFNRILEICLYSCGICIAESYTNIGWEG